MAMRDFGALRFKMVGEHVAKLFADFWSFNFQEMIGSSVHFDRGLPQKFVAEEQFVAYTVAKMSLLPQFELHVAALLKSSFFPSKR